MVTHLFVTFQLSTLWLALGLNDSGNPANDLVEIINQNRTAQKLAQLNDSPGLGCMALQYVELCKGNCSGNSAVNCKPPDDDFTEVFAPNCGVELPSIGTITGHFVGCQSKYTDPSLAFANVLVNDNKSLSVVRTKSHSEVGVGLIGFHKGPFFWCVLFSNGGTNSSFVLEDRGEGIKQKKGCYSGSAFPCNVGQRSAMLFNYIITFELFIHFAVKPHLIDILNCSMRQMTLPDTITESYPCALMQFSQLYSHFSLFLYFFGLCTK